jgi:hypothetical protein
MGVYVLEEQLWCYHASLVNFGMNGIAIGLYPKVPERKDCEGLNICGCCKVLSKKENSRLENKRKIMEGTNRARMFTAECSIT